MPTQISVTNVGPVSEFEYDLDAFGMHVLRGPQGAGKTTILRTVQLATDGRTDVRPTRKDGAARGEATVAGRTLRISKNTRTEGELTVDGLGDLDIASLHTPKFSSLNAREKHRIKTLVRLGGVKSDPSLFYDLVGGKSVFDDVVSLGSIDTDDLVEMSAKIKRDFESRAIDCEGRSETLNATMRAKLSIAEGIDLDAPHDAHELQAATMEAATAVSLLKQRREDGLAAIDNATKAEAAIKEAEDGGVSVADAKSRFDKIQEDRLKHDEEISEASKKLNAMNIKRVEYLGASNNASKTLEIAKRQEQTFAKLRGTIEAGKGVECPTEEEIEEAEDIHEESTIAVTNGVRVRDAISATKEASECKARINAAIDEAKRFRDAAADTHEVLSDAIERIPDCPLRVKVMDDGATRLVLKTDRSADEPFDDLSDGERWPIILQLASAANRLIVLPQAAYGEFSPATRRQLHQLAIENKCYLLTAQADDGELRAGIYEAASGLQGVA